jgi:hypothetical protein
MGKKENDSMGLDKKDVWKAQRELLLIKAQSSKRFHMDMLSNPLVDDMDDLAYHASRAKAWNDVANHCHRLLGSVSPV